MKEKGATLIIAIVVLLLIAVLSATIFYLWIETKMRGYLPKEELCGKIKIEGVKVGESGSLIIYARNLENIEIVVTGIYITDFEGRVLLFEKGIFKLKPKEVREIVLQNILLHEIAENASEFGEYFVKLASGSAEASFPIAGSVLKACSQRGPFKKIVLLADTSGDALGGKFHWVCFDYSSGKYIIYDNYTGTVRKVSEGFAAVIMSDSYTISTSWVPWDERPVDSPIVIVLNPTLGGKDWVFEWHDPDGVFKFYVEALSGEIEADFLVFWEDLFNPASPPARVDDWKDHVVRVTAFSNGTYRIAVYLAEGGYAHQFYLTSVDPSKIFQVSYLYRKPGGAWWDNFDGTYQREFKVFIVKR